MTSNPTHMALVMVLTDHDRALNSQARLFNPYRLGLYLKALEDAEGYPTIGEGLKACFEGRLLKALLKALDRVRGGV